MHQSRMWYNGTLTITVKPFIDRFWEKVNKTANCWLWTGSKDKCGYGRLHHSDRTQSAHRFIYQYLNGPIQAPFVVMHTCDNPSCVNPAHLKLATIQQNALDALSKERFTQAKLNWNKVREIRRQINQRIPTKEIAMANRIGLGQIYRIAHKKQWVE